MRMNPIQKIKYFHFHFVESLKATDTVLHLVNNLSAWNIHCYIL